MRTFALLGETGTVIGLRLLPLDLAAEPTAKQADAPDAQLASLRRPAQALAFANDDQQILRPSER